MPAVDLNRLQLQVRIQVRISIAGGLDQTSLLSLSVCGFRLLLGCARLYSFHRRLVSLQLSLLLFFWRNCARFHLSSSPEFFRQSSLRLRRLRPFGLIGAVLILPSENGNFDTSIRRTMANPSFKDVLNTREDGTIPMVEHPLLPNGHHLGTQMMEIFTLRRRSLRRI